MEIEGAGSRNHRVRKGDVRLELKPIDREAFLEKLQLGHVVKGRILRQFDGTTYLLRLLGHNLVAESEGELPQGSNLRFRVRSLEPRVDLQLLEDLPEEETAAKEAVLDRLLRSVGKNPDDVGRYVLNRMMTHHVPATANNVTEFKAVFVNTDPENREMELEARLLLRANRLPETEGNLLWARTAVSRPRVVQTIVSLLESLDEQNPTHQKLKTALQDFPVKLMKASPSREASLLSTLVSTGNVHRELENHIKAHPSCLEALAANEAPSARKTEERKEVPLPREVIPVLRKNLFSLVETARKALLTMPSASEQLGRYARELARLLEGGEITPARREEIFTLLSRWLSDLPETESSRDLRDQIRNVIKSLSLDLNKEQSRTIERFDSRPLPRGDEFMRLIHKLLVDQESKKPEEQEQIPQRLLLRPLLMEVSKENTPAATMAQRLLAELDARTILRNMPSSQEQTEIRPWLTFQVPIRAGGEIHQAEIAIRRSDEREMDGRPAKINPRQTTLAFVLNTSRMGTVKAVADIDAKEIFIQMGVFQDAIRKHLKQGESELRKTIDENTGLTLSRFDVMVAPPRDKFQNKASLAISLMEEPEFPRDGGLGLDVVV